MFRTILHTVNAVSQRFLSVGVVLYALYIVVHDIQEYARYGHLIISTPNDVLRAMTYPLIFLCFGIGGILPPRWIKMRITLWCIGALIALLWIGAVFSGMQQMPF